MCDVFVCPSMLLKGNKFEGINVVIDHWQGGWEKLKNYVVENCTRDLAPQLADFY